MCEDFCERERLFLFTKFVSWRHGEAVAKKGHFFYKGAPSARAFGAGLWPPLASISYYLCNYRRPAKLLAKAAADGSIRAALYNSSTVALTLTLTLTLALTLTLTLTLILTLTLTLILTLTITR